MAEAAILTIDCVAEWTTASIGRETSNCVELLQEAKIPHSPAFSLAPFIYSIF